MFNHINGGKFVCIGHQNRCKCLEILFDGFQIEFQEQIAGFNFVAVFYLWREIFSVQSDSLQTYMDQHFSTGISHQGDGVLCVKYRGDSSIHRTVEFAFGRQNGYALTQDAVRKCSIRNFGKLYKFTVHRRAYSQVRKPRFRIAVRRVVLLGNFYRIIKSDDLNQDNS